MKNLADEYGPWALVTGASSGIGAEMARRLAGDGVNVVIAARRLDRLNQLAAELEAVHGVEMRPVQADLTSQDGIDAIDKAVADIDLAIVVNNAGAAHPGAFLKTPADDQLDVIRLNIMSPVELASLLGRRLVERPGPGAMIFTGSTSAYAGIANLANYAATKAYIGSFAEALHREWRRHDVDVLVVHPGPTRTEMVEMDGVDFNAVPMNWMTPDQVADQTFKALGRKPVLVPGAANRIQKFVFTRLLPRRVTNAVWSGLMGRVTDDDRR